MQNKQKTISWIQRVPLRALINLWYLSKSININWLRKRLIPSTLSSREIHHLLIKESKGSFRIAHKALIDVSIETKSNTLNLNDVLERIRTNIRKANVR